MMKKHRPDEISHQRLVGLCGLALGVLDGLVADGEATRLAAPRLRAKVTQFEYAEGLKSLRMQYVWQQERTWNEDVVGRVCQAVGQTEEFSTLAHEVSQTTRLSKDQASHNLGLLVRLAVAKAADDRLGEGDVLDLATLFLRDLAAEATEWDVTAWLRGVWLGEGGGLELEPGTVLRAVTPEDMEDAYSYDVTMGFVSSPGSLGYSMPSAILEGEHKWFDQAEAARWLDQTTAILRLYRLGSVDSLVIWYRPKSVLRLPNRAGGGRLVETPYRYGVWHKESDELRQIFKVLRPVIPIDTWAARNSKRAYDIGLSRYTDALLGSGSAESRITSAVTCLEALYLRGDERAELSRRLAQRVAALLMHRDFDALDVQRNVAAAYKIRSAFVHGATSKSKGRPSIPQLCASILEYSRVSLQILYQQTEHGKDAIIELLDESLLSSTTRDEIGTDLLDKVLTTA